MLAADAAGAAVRFGGGEPHGHPLGALWLLAWLLLGAAALHPSLHADAEPPVPEQLRGLGRTRLALLAGASLAAPLVLTLQAARGTRLGVGASWRPAPRCCSCWSWCV
jgi:hypothetical protein